jgi:hypothetical protein
VVHVLHITHRSGRSLSLSALEAGFFLDGGYNETPLLQNISQCLAARTIILYLPLIKTWRRNIGVAWLDPLLFLGTLVITRIIIITTSLGMCKKTPKSRQSFMLPELLTGSSFVIPSNLLWRFQGNVKVYNNNTKIKLKEAQWREEVLELSKDSEVSYKGHTIRKARKFLWPSIVLHCCYALLCRGNDCVSWWRPSLSIHVCFRSCSWKSVAAILKSDLERTVDWSLFDSRMEATSIRIDSFPGYRYYVYVDHGVVSTVSRKLSIAYEYHMALRSSSIWLSSCIDAYTYIQILLPILGSHQQSASSNNQIECLETRDPYHSRGFVYAEIIGQRNKEQ